MRAHASKYEHLSNYQRAQLRGFTTQGLVDLGCFNDEDVQKCDLGFKDSPIHPLLEKHRWKSDEGGWHGVPANVFGEGGGGLFGKVSFTIAVCCGRGVMCEVSKRLSCGEIWLTRRF